MTYFFHTMKFKFQKVNVNKLMIRLTVLKMFKFRIDTVTKI